MSPLRRRAVRNEFAADATNLAAAGRKLHQIRPEKLVATNATRRFQTINRRLPRAEE
jgi:hypothetical protein